MASDSNGSSTSETPDDPTPNEILAPDGVASRSAPEASDEAPSEAPEVEPAKIIRIGAMVKQLLEELREIELDEPSRDQLRDIYSNSVTELKTALSPGTRRRTRFIVIRSSTTTISPQRWNCDWPRPSWWAGWRASSTACRLP